MNRSKLCMATANQIKANQQNALRSTGPKTSVGKMITSRNATKHGFYSTSVLLPDEDLDESMKLGRRLVSAYKPCGVREEQKDLLRTTLGSPWFSKRFKACPTNSARFPPATGLSSRAPRATPATPAGTMSGFKSRR
jgi:hypothetical protein